MIRNLFDRILWKFGYVRKCMQDFAITGKCRLVRNGEVEDVKGFVVKVGWSADPNFMSYMGEWYVPLSAKQEVTVVVEEAE